MGTLIIGSTLTPLIIKCVFGGAVAYKILKPVFRRGKNG